MIYYDGEEKRSMSGINISVPDITCFFSVELLDKNRKKVMYKNNKRETCKFKRPGVGALGNSNLCSWCGKKPLHTPCYSQNWGCNEEQLTSTPNNCKTPQKTGERPPNRLHLIFFCGAMMNGAQGHSNYLITLPCIFICVQLTDQTMFWEVPTKFWRTPLINK